MKHKLKKIFENAVWWSGVVMVGLILGVSLQFVRAWTEPTVAPPGGNVGAPINTGPLTQAKNGILSLVGLSTQYLNVPGNVPAAGNVLTAQNAQGQLAWAAGGGGGPENWQCQLAEGPSNDQGSAVDCPIGTRLITGGCSADGSGALNFNQPKDNGNHTGGWNCNSSSMAGSSNSKAFAWCCK